MNDGCFYYKVSSRSLPTLQLIPQAPIQAAFKFLRGLLHTGPRLCTLKQKWIIRISSKNDWKQYNYNSSRLSIAEFLAMEIKHGSLSLDQEAAVSRRSLCSII